MPLRVVLDSGPRVAQICLSMSDLSFPLRMNGQSLHAYVRAHLPKFEYERWAGVPYSSLANALGTVGFEAVSVRSLQTAVYRARKGTCKKWANSGLSLRGAELGTSISKPSGIPPLPWRQTQPRSSTGDGPADIARMLRELARPPRPGEKDPLD